MLCSSLSRGILRKASNGSIRCQLLLQVFGFGKESCPYLVACCSNRLGKKIIWSWGGLFRYSSVATKYSFKVQRIGFSGGCALRWFLWGRALGLLEKRVHVKTHFKQVIVQRATSTNPAQDGAVKRIVPINSLIWQQELEWKRYT